MTPILEVQGLTTQFRFPDRTLTAVSDLNLTVAAGETVALVGESGCGKSITAYSILGLLPPPAAVTAGKILFEGTNLLDLSANQMRSIRGNKISMIFQEPMTSLNPVFKVGPQIAEGLMLHRRLSFAQARQETITLLGQVGIPAKRFDDYPHQMSGGLRQRIMIAMALACNPRLLIADEPTTALDVTIQAQILELMETLRSERTMAMILITHDLGIVAEYSHRTAVMYAGQMVEYAPTAELFDHPLHPYTQRLLASLPQKAEPGKPLPVIGGSVPRLDDRMRACGFSNRCPDSSSECLIDPPALVEETPGHFVRCRVSA